MIKNMQLVKDFLKKHEGFRSNTYQDIVGVKTIGYGFTSSFEACKPYLDKGSITLQEADVLLETLIKKIAYDISFYNAFRDLNQYKQCALISFVFNLGITNYRKSQLALAVDQSAYALCLESDEDGIKRQFLRWNKAGGKEIKGLTKRRQEEAELFLKGA